MEALQRALAIIRDFLIITVILTGMFLAVKFDLAAHDAVAKFEQPAAVQTPDLTWCKDGTSTTSTGRGTCSGHGGVQRNG